MAMGKITACPVFFDQHAAQWNEVRYCVFVVRESVPGTISEEPGEWALESSQNVRTALDYAEAFTDRFAELEHTDPISRESEMLRVQFRAILNLSFRQVESSGWRRSFL